MNGKHFVGKRAQSFERFEPEAPVDGVRLLLDDENGFEAGDMEGNVWEMECPYATQAMADNVLASLSGQVYKGFEAAAAPLGPEAELGDGVTVNGLYSVLAYQDTTFGPGHRSDIAAPGDDEPEEEYKYVSQKQREEARKLGKIRSYITKTAEEIRAAVEGVDGRVSELTVDLESVTSQVTGLDGRVSKVEQTATGLTSTVEGLGGQFTSLEQTVNGFTFRDESGKVWINNGSINLTGSITWGDLDTGVQADINNRGVSSATVHTIINQDLVASPNIAGGKFWDLSQKTWIEMGTEGSGYGGMLVKSKAEFETETLLNIYNADSYNVGISSNGTTFLRLHGRDGTAIALGTWDFSEADRVTGLYLRFA